MNATTLLLISIIVINSLFIIRFVQDLLIHKSTLAQEPGNKYLLAFSLPVIFFFSTLGISDFATSTLFYRKKKLISDKLLPGTLNTQCVIPVAVMALAFISVIAVDIKTLIVCIVAQIVGAYVGPSIVVKLSATTIRKFLGIGLLLATFFILASKFKLIPSGGTAIALSNTKLVIAAVCLAVFGALNNIGIGSYAPTMVTVYALGLNPAVAFPIMMGASAFAVPIGSMQFIKYGKYGRKITLFAASCGVLGVLLGIYLVKSLNVELLQWVLAAILLYSGVSMLAQEWKKTNQVAYSN